MALWHLCSSAQFALDRTGFADVAPLLVLPSSLPSLLPSLPTSTPPCNNLVGWVTFMVGVGAGNGWLRRPIGDIAEFQTPTLFDCDCEFDYSTFYRSPKIVKIIRYILYIHRNVTTNSIWAILIYGIGHMVISFESYRISLYIDIPRPFWNSVNEDQEELKIRDLDTMLPWEYDTLIRPHNINIKTGCKVIKKFDIS